MKFDKNKLGALTVRNFRYFWIGQCISIIGTWMQSTGQSWIVYDMTGSAEKLSYITTLQTLPVLVLSIFAGVFVDRYRKRRVVITTQILSMMLAFILAFLVLFKYINYYQILIIALFLGIVNTFDMPARQTFVKDIVGKEHLLNAIVLNSAIFNLARIVGPAISGYMIAFIGTGWCFFINGVSFIFVIIGLSLIDVEGEPVENRVQKKVTREIKEGFKYISKNIELSFVIIIVLITSIFCMNFGVIIPVLARQKLNLGASEYGFLMAFLGIGAFIASVSIAIIKPRKISSFVVYIGAIGLALTNMLLGFLKTQNENIVGLFFMGIFLILMSATANTFIQMNSKEEFRGRVMSVYTMMYVGSMPIGSLLTGWLITNVGFDKTLKIYGVIGTLIVLLLRIIQKIIEKRTQK